MVIEGGFDRDVEEGCAMDIAHIDTEDGGQVAVVPPVYNYACRGPNLRHLNVLEYASLLVLEKGEPKENVRNARFLFHFSHVMVQQWREQLLSQFRVPILLARNSLLGRAKVGMIKLNPLGHNTCKHCLCPAILIIPLHSKEATWKGLFMPGPYQVHST